MTIAMPIHVLLTPLLGAGDEAVPLLYGAVGTGLAVIVLGLWLLFGKGPRRRRAYNRAQKLLGEGSWEPALTLVSRLQERGRHAPRWQARLNRLAGECQQAAAAESLREKRFETSLQLSLKAAPVLGQDPRQARGRVVEAMLAEVRRLLAANSKAEPETVLGLIARIFPIQPVCPEASFWQALCYLKQGQPDRAITSLEQARRVDEENGKEKETKREGEKETRKKGETVQPAGRTASRSAGGFIDPPLYLGALLLREGRPEEALRSLAEANRLDSSCPFVTWQLGTAMLAAGGDCLIAVKALQRALGPRGLEMWKNASARAWVEGFPERLSFIRRLASQHPFHCPLFGSDVAAMIRQGQVALAQGQYRLANFEEAAKIFTQSLQEGAPDLPILRGLGLALARLDRYDQAFKHLRTAYEMEDPKDALTAGYLALCGAKGKPTRPEDKEKNVLWAIRLVGKLSFPKNAEWATLLSHLYAEARAAQVPVSIEDQARLCDLLVSLGASDPLAAESYAALAAALLEKPAGALAEGKNGDTRLPGEKEKARPGDTEVGKGGDTELRAVPGTLASLPPQCAWLYCRAVQEHGVTCANDLELFARTLATEPQARAFYAERKWAIDDVELLYLERCAVRRPGAFPPALGPDYPSRGELLLLERSLRLEEIQDREGALRSAEVLLKLAPASAAAHDRLAYLAHRARDLDRAVHLLEAWHQLAPHDPLPLARLAVLEQERGHHARRAERIRNALRMARGQNRAEIAFLGARLALQEWLTMGSMDAGQEGRNGDQKAAQLAVALEPWRDVLDLLDECLEEDPEHESALWCKAAVLYHLGRRSELSGLAAALGKLASSGGPGDARFYLMSAVCYLAAVDHEGARRAARMAAGKRPELAADCDYLIGWTEYRDGNLDAAAQALRKPAETSACLSNGPARALLARICFARGGNAEAIAWWKCLTPVDRKAWGIDEPLRRTLFVMAIEQFQAGEFEAAAEKAREAGRLGLKDSRLGPLLALALIKAGQRLLYS